MVEIVGRHMGFRSKSKEVVPSKNAFLEVNFLQLQSTCLATSQQSPDQGSDNPLGVELWGSGDPLRVLTSLSSSASTSGKHCRAARPLVWRKGYISVAFGHFICMLWVDDLQLLMHIPFLLC